MRANRPVPLRASAPKELRWFRAQCNALPNGTSEWSHDSASAGTSAVLDKKRSHARMGIKRWFDLGESAKSNRTLSRHSLSTHW
jgi:hypothetical protein